MSDERMDTARGASALHVAWAGSGARAYWIIAIAALLLMLLFAVTARQAGSQANGATQVGVGLSGVNLYEFTGRVDQEGFDFTGYGYLSYVRGLELTDLFANPLDPSESSAHFTYYATAAMTSRTVISGIFHLNSTGTITFYRQISPTATFVDPTSFAQGEPIATATIRFQDILSVQAPNQGIAVGVGEFTFLSVEPFEIGDDTYQFGYPGMVQRVSTFGQGTRTDPVLPRSFTVLAGNAVNTGQTQTFLPSQSNRSPAANRAR
jgi:hypothetical protein